MLTFFREKHVEAVKCSLQAFCTKYSPKSYKVVKKRRQKQTLSMDKSGRSLNFSSLSPFSTKSPRTPITNPRRSVAALPSSANRNSSRYSVSGRSTQSTQVIYKTQFHVVESYGTPLPVMVTEALAYADRSSTVSVRLSTSGWAWFVCGRRLLVWQYRQEGQGRWAPGSQCRELTLPASDLAHRAQLVTVFVPERAHVPSCIAVSPEGAVRYWSSIAHEGSWIEENADLQGQECDSLSDMTVVGCILATTTSTICLVAPKTSGGRHSILCHKLRSPQTWIGGFSRRVSSIIFGTMQSSHALETRLIKVVVTDPNSTDGCGLLVLAGHSLQKWQLSCTKDSERMVFDFDMDRLIRDNFLNAVWDPNTNSAQELSIWLLDMQPVENGVMLLIAASNSQASAQIYYAAALVMTDKDQAPDCFQLFIALKFSGYYQGEEAENECLNYQFLLYGSTALVYNRKQLLAVPVNNSHDEVDRIDFINSGDCILGGSLCNNIPIFFSRSHGLISVCLSDTAHLDMMNASMSYSEAQSVDHLSVSHLNESVTVNLTGIEIEDLAVESDSASKLKAAFVYFNRRELAQCQEILMDIFPPEFERKLDIDAPLDLVVVQVSQDIVNDIPAADPRWAETHIGTGLSTSTSLQILQQLQGKQQTMELYIHFLKSVNIWNRLSALSVRGVALATAQAIQEHAEKIAAAVALRNLHTKYADVVDKIIKSSLKLRKIKPKGGLTHLDLFFQEVTKVHEALQSLGNLCTDVVHSNKSPLEVVDALQEANTVMLETLQQVSQFRKQYGDMFSADHVTSSDVIEYLPWTAAPGDEGLRDTLTLQLENSVMYGTRQASNDMVLRTALCESLLGIADILLDGYRTHLESIRGGEKHDLLVHQYELQRRKIIKPFLDEGMTEAATKLAEKYLDFQTLVQLCEVTKNQERLDQYIQKFAEHGFSEFVFGWYMKEGKQDKLLKLFGGNGRPMQHQQALVGFLNQHPQLAWLQALRAQQYAAASNTLRMLADSETEKLARKKNILSLAKLATLASDEPTETIDSVVRNIDVSLGVVNLQEELPQSILNFLNQDADNMPVYTPARLIDLYISTENEDANMYDFRKALELLDFVEDDITKEELKQRIWSQAVLRDNWENIELSYPMDACEKLLVFNLLGLVLSTDNTEFILPLETMLECSHLGAIAQNSNYKFLVQFYYQQLSSSMDCQ